MGTDENRLAEMRTLWTLPDQNPSGLGVGNPRTKVLLIGEAPGKNEDEQGEPLWGEADSFWIKCSP